ncbi:MAG: ATP synthase subunit I [Deltaproteobacteria bacterium]|nr:ATP synthase subunit I [Deltaproteobacteria bacterium]
MNVNETYAGSEAVLARATRVVGTANVAVAGIAMIALAVFTKDTHSVLSFTSGFIVGLLNLYSCLKIIRSSMTLPQEAIEGFIKKRYMAKFSFSILLLVLLIWFAKLNPLTLLAGYTATIIVTLVTLILILKGEFKDNVGTHQ